MTNFTFTGKAGWVTGAASLYPHCCGIGIISACSFYLYELNSDLTEKQYRRKKLKLYEEFQKYIISIKGPYNMRRSVLLMADTQDGDMADFCKSMKWTEEKVFRNAKTLNKVGLWSLYRKDASVADAIEGY